MLNIQKRRIFRVKEFLKSLNKRFIFHIKEQNQEKDFIINNKFRKQISKKKIFKIIDLKYKNRENNKAIKY